MNKTEFAKFAMALKTYYPRETILPNAEAIDLWFIQLQDMDYQIAEAVLNKWVAVNKWPPTISDIRGEASKIINGELPDWGESWEKVFKAIGYYGMYKPQEALDSFDEITRKCVERLGFVNLCTSENTSADRANFRKMYEAYAERMKTELQMPVTTKERIEHLKSAVVKIEGGTNGQLLRG